MNTRLLLVPIILLAFFTSCTHKTDRSLQTIPIISWGGIPADKADTLYSLALECGFDTHLGLYGTQKNALLSMDAAARQGIGIIINFPQIKDSTDKAVALIKDHPALVAYHIKDEPDTSDFVWLKALKEKIGTIDSEHPVYINLLPNWAWGENEYTSRLEEYADMIDPSFFSFDHYPVVEEDGRAVVRPEWYRNLEEFSAMARRHGKPFWAFALATSHSITQPCEIHYPVPTSGHLRLQVFSNLLYGAQAIQYFNFTGIVDPATCRKKPAFELIRQVNMDIKAYSYIFHGCEVSGVWHTGSSIPSDTSPLDQMPHKKVRSLEMSGDGAVVSLLENAGKQYLAVQNRDCNDPAILDITFRGDVRRITPEGEVLYDGKPITLQPGDITLFRL